MNKLDTGGLKAVVFDWDGTLAETRTPRLWAVNRIITAYGLHDWESTRDRQNPLLSFMDNFPLVFGARAEAAYAEYAALYKANVARMIKTFPGVRETLAFLTERGIKICIMTNKDRRLLDFELPLLFSPSLFARIACGHEAARDKPARTSGFAGDNGAGGNFSANGMGGGRQCARQYDGRGGGGAADTDCRPQGDGKSRSADCVF